MFISRSNLILFVLTAYLALPTAGHGQGADKPGAVRTVLVFDKLCYEMLPNLASLEQRAAKHKWMPITGAALRRFAPAVTPEVLKAWRFKDLGTGFQIAITKSALDAQAKKSFPKFADGKAFACSLILPANSPRATIAAAMVKLMERKPDESSDQGRLKVDAWNGATDKLRVFIHHMAPKTGAPGGLLSVTLMVKN